MKLQLFVITLVITAISSGCATLSENQCRLGDWQGIGFSDGTNGYALGRFEEHQKACAEYGVAPKLHEYQSGYEKGLLQYCVPSNGYLIGRQGKSYYGVCTGPGSDEFLRNYHAGKREYEIKDLEREKNTLLIEAGAKGIFGNDFRGGKW